MKIELQGYSLPFTHALYNERGIVMKTKITVKKKTITTIEFHHYDLIIEMQECTIFDNFGLKSVYCTLVCRSCYIVSFEENVFYYCLV